MNRTEKQAEVVKLGDQVKRSVALYVADYKGVNVEQITSLRKELATHKDVEMKVVKNRLFMKAVEKESFASEIEDHMTGTNAVIFSYVDPAGPAKVILKFGETVEHWKVKTGLLKGRILDEAAIKALATLPSREVLLSKMLASMNAPASNLVMVLAAVPRSVLNVLNAIKEKKEKEV